MRAPLIHIAMCANMKYTNITAICSHVIDYLSSENYSSIQGSTAYP